MYGILSLYYTFYKNYYADSLTHIYSVGLHADMSDV